MNDNVPMIRIYHDIIHVYIQDLLIYKMYDSLYFFLVIFKARWQYDGAPDEGG
jgi:hypothetical protein